MQTSSSDVNAAIRELNQETEEFFREAFTNPVTQQPYAVPDDIRTASRRICQAFGIRGSCDPMWIANVIAVATKRGDGFSNFTEVK